MSWYKTAVRVKLEKRTEFGSDHEFTRHSGRFVFEKLPLMHLRRLIAAPTDYAGYGYGGIAHLLVCRYRTCEHRPVLLYGNNSVLMN